MILAQCTNGHIASYPTTGVNPLTGARLFVPLSRFVCQACDSEKLTKVLQSSAEGQAHLRAIVGLAPKQTRRVADNKGAKQATLNMVEVA